MSDKTKFSEKLTSYELQAGEHHCYEDWIDHVYTAVRDYIVQCEQENRRGSIKELKQEIINTAKSGTFDFD